MLLGVLDITARLYFERRRPPVHRNAPARSLERTRPWQSALDLFAVNEIKGPIIEFFGKLLPPSPGNERFSRTCSLTLSPKIRSSWPLISFFLRELFAD